MADHTPTEDQVFEAALNLTQSHQPITVSTVREALGGSGNYTTINRYLAAWRAQYQAPEAAAAEVPPEIERVMAAATQSVWHAAARHARAAIDEIKQLSQQQLAQQEAELAEARGEITRLEGESRSRDEALNLARLEFDGLNEQLAAAHAELALLQERTRQQDARLQEHQSQIQRSQSDVERERSGAERAGQEAEEARLTITSLREETQEARREIARLEEELSDQAETLTQAQGETQRMAENAQQLSQALEQANHHRQGSEHEFERLQDRYAQSQTEMEKLLQALESERQRRQDNENTLTELRETAAALKAERAAEERRSRELASQVEQLQARLFELVTEASERSQTPPAPETELASNPSTAEA